MVAGGAAFWSCTDCIIRSRTVSITNCEFIDNYAELSSVAVSTHYFEFDAIGYGGVMYLYGSTMGLFNSSIIFYIIVYFHKIQHIMVHYILLQIMMKLI